MNSRLDLPVRLQVIAALLIAPGLFGIAWELVAIISAMFQPVFAANPVETPLTALYYVLFVSVPIWAIPVALGIGLLWRSEMFRWLSILYMAVWSVWKLPTVLIMVSVYMDGKSNEPPFALFVLSPVYMVLSFAYVWAIYALFRSEIREVFQRDCDEALHAINKDMS